MMLFRAAPSLLTQRSTARQDTPNRCTYDKQTEQQSNTCTTCDIQGKGDSTTLGRDRSPPFSSSTKLNIFVPEVFPCSSTCLCCIVLCCAMRGIQYLCTGVLAAVCLCCDIEVFNPAQYSMDKPAGVQPFQALMIIGFSLHEFQILLKYGRQIKHKISNLFSKCILKAKKGQTIKVF